MFPPLPSWDGLHPLIIHFPIALLLIAPVLILMGIFASDKGRGFLVSAFVLMLIGTIAAWVAVSTGSAAGELAERTASVGAMLEDHESLAGTTRTVFTILTGLFAVLLVIPRLFSRRAVNDVALVSGSSKGVGRRFGFSGVQKTMVALTMAFLLFYGAGLVLLVNTAHAGGALVHQFGVRAVMEPAGPAANRAPARPDDDD